MVGAWNTRMKEVSKSCKLVNTEAWKEVRKVLIWWNHSGTKHGFVWISFTRTSLTALGISLELPNPFHFTSILFYLFYAELQRMMIKSVSMNFEAQHPGWVVHLSSIQGISFILYYFDHLYLWDGWTDFDDISLEYRPTFDKLLHRHWLTAAPFISLNR